MITSQTSGVQLLSYEIHFVQIFKVNESRIDAQSSLANLTGMFGSVFWGNNFVDAFVVFEVIEGRVSLCKKRRFEIVDAFVVFEVMEGRVTRVSQKKKSMS